MTLLQRFAHESDEATMQADEPAMFFRRNVNLSQDREIAVGFFLRNIKAISKTLRKSGDFV